MIILLQAKKEIGGIFMHVAQSRSVRVARAACEMFWFGRKNTRVDEEDEIEDDATLVESDVEGSPGKQRSMKKILVRTDDVVRTGKGKGEVPNVV
jgi:hypothetical protein